MPDRCPVCGQSLPAAINDKLLQTRIAKLSSAALAVEKQKLQNAFDAQLEAAREESRQAAERQFERKLQAAETRAQREAQASFKKELAEAERSRKRDIDLAVLKAARENDSRLDKIQRERERERTRYEAESAKLQGKMEELARKLDKQSGEQLGSEAELDLFAELRRAFPRDKVERIGRGVKGADIIHEVMDGAKSAGRIVYESKNTTSWQHAFVIQAKKYVTQYETPHVMIVTRVFPSKAKGLCVLKGIPVVDKRMAISLATIIREGIIEISRLRPDGESQEEKSQELYRYIVGDGFQTRFREIAESVALLREQQQKERTWHENAWQAGSKIHSSIEGRQREVEAQIRAIVGGRNGRASATAAQPAKLRALVPRVRQAQTG